MKKGRKSILDNILDTSQERLQDDPESENSQTEPDTAALQETSGSSQAEVSEKEIQGTPMEDRYVHSCDLYEKRNSEVEFAIGT